MLPQAQIAIFVHIRTIVVHSNDHCEWRVAALWRQAAEGSLRREILQRWKELGLASEPGHTPRRWDTALLLRGKTPDA